MGRATEAAAAISAGALSPVDLVEESLEQIGRLDETIQAWVTVASEEARRTALQRSREAPRGRLHGLPVGIKDIFDVAGLPTQAGAPPFAHRVPGTDAAVVARLKEAGAIVMGKTATTQFAFADPAPTRNPRNLEHTPGGSSSGSAAAVAAGMTPLALGSQTVGSTLRPAAFCGIVGLKPTYDLLSTEGAIPLAWSLDHPGILASDVADAWLMFNAVTGADAPAGPGEPERQRSIGLLDWDYEEQPSDEVAGHVAAVAGLLEKEGAAVEAVAAPANLSAGLAAGFLIIRSEAAAYHRSLYAGHLEEYGPRIREMLREGLTIRAADYVMAQRARAQLREELDVLFAKFDALLLPVAATPAPHGLASTGTPNSFCGMASFTGLPSIAVPSGVSAGGLPLGVQLVGGPWQEEKLLDTAAWVEAALDFKPSWERPAPGGRQA